MDGNWRHAETEEIPCELKREQHFLGSGVPAQILEEENGSLEKKRVGWGG
jgi:hypothetical protein